MAQEEPLGPIEQEIQIIGLKREAAELAGGEMTAWESEDCPPEVALQFWENVVAYERAPWTTHFDQLMAAGVALPSPEEMDDAQLRAKLHEVIEKLAARRIFLESTDHMSDRQLYTRLWSETLREQTPDITLGPDSACHIDFASSGSEEDTNAYLRYYADDEDRRHWVESFPDEVLQPHEKAPYDRDRFMPQATYRVLEDEDPEGVPEE